MQNTAKHVRRKLLQKVATYRTIILIDWNLGYLFRESRMTTTPMVLSFRSSKANTNVSNIAEFLSLQ